jgi:hypothetical protein
LRLRRNRIQVKGLIKKIRVWVDFGINIERYSIMIVYLN